MKIQRYGTLNRDSALQAARDQLETPLWGILAELEKALSSLVSVPHVNIECPRAVGSVLNSALPQAALASGLEEHGAEVRFCSNGQCHKISCNVVSEGKTYPVSLELHLSGPKGGTTKSRHQFAYSEPAVCDIEEQPSLIELDIEAPDRLLFFVACHLAGTGVSIARAYLKFADGVDQRMIEIHRPEADAKQPSADTGPLTGPIGTTLKVRKPKGDEREDGIKTDQRGDAASGSKETT